mmetsp:Transcript_12436/g.30211  ORF Transcript_12436/g.30211 Transcript_12436/m.30211 type:complete len:223 (-) Transcript_12436:844-1512(-)
MENSGDGLEIRGKRGRTFRLLVDSSGDIWSNDTPNQSSPKISLATNRHLPSTLVPPHAWDPRGAVGAAQSTASRRVLGGPEFCSSFQKRHREHAGVVAPLFHWCVCFDEVQVVSGDCVDVFGVPRGLRHGPSIRSVLPGGDRGLATECFSTPIGITHRQSSTTARPDDQPVCASVHSAAGFVPVFLRAELDLQIRQRPRLPRPPVLARGRGRDGVFLRLLEV